MPASCPPEISLSQIRTTEMKARIEGGNLLYFLCPAEETKLFTSLKNTQSFFHVQNFACAFSYEDRQKEISKPPSFSSAGSLLVAMVTGRGKDGDEEDECSEM